MARRLQGNYIRVVIGETVDFVHALPRELAKLPPHQLDEYAVGLIVNTILALENEGFGLAEDEDIED